MRTKTGVLKAKSVIGATLQTVIFPDEISIKINSKH